MKTEDQTDSLSWVVFSEDDKPECENSDCTKEAVKLLGPVECCNQLYPYCIDCLKMHQNWLDEDLAFGIGLTHEACNGLFFTYRIENL